MVELRRVLLVLSLSLVGSLLFTSVPGRAATTPTPKSPGYWLAGADGGIFAFDAPFYGSGVASGGLGACTFTPQPPSTLNGSLGCDAIAAPPGGTGYWVLNIVRQPTPFGQAGLGAPPGGCTSLNGAQGSWSGMASSISGAGYSLVSSNAGVLGCGDVQPPYGGLTSMPLNAPVVGMAATPDGRGYWLVTADGGVFCVRRRCFRRFDGRQGTQCADRGDRSHSGRQWLLVGSLRRWDLRVWERLVCGIFGWQAN